MKKNIIFNLFSIGNKCKVQIILVFLNEMTEDKKYNYY